MVSGRIEFSFMDIQEKITQLQRYYSPVNLDPSFYSKKVICIKKLKYILKRCPRKNLQDCDFEHVVICALALVYYFGMRLKFHQLNFKHNRLAYWCGKRKFHRAEYAFQKTMNQLLPERSKDTIKIILNFFAEYHTWPFESFMGQILEIVLYFDRGNTTLFRLILTDIHYVLFIDIKAARHRMRVLYELLKSPNWVINKAQLLPFVTCLLDFFAYSIAKGDTQIVAYNYLRKGYDVCLRRIFRRVKNEHRLTIIKIMLDWFSTVHMNDDEILEFSSLVEYATQLYEVTTYADSFGENLFENILSHLVGSSNHLYSLVGSRLLQRLLDRQRNAPFLLVPTLYYEFSQVRLKIGEYKSRDKEFISNYRENLHEYILRAVKQHCHKTVNLISIFAVICSLVLEVPCGLTAAVAASMAMAIQDYAINGENLAGNCRYWMHAIVICVISLICWVHNASVLYSYVSHIISRRAKEAPQLNPPLLQLYNIGHHHITWNKPTLFFEDWELRYGLWKHFKDIDVARKDSQDKKDK